MKTFFGTFGLVIFLSTFLGAQGYRSDILPYVQGGRMDYSVQVSLAEIDYSFDRASLEKELTALEMAFFQSGDPLLLLRCFDLWDTLALNLDKEAVAARAYELWGGLGSSLATVAETALLVEVQIEAGLRSGNGKYQQEAWNELESRLVKGPVPSERLFKESLRLFKGLFEWPLALKISELYRESYPESAEAWFSRADVLMVYNLTRIVGPNMAENLARFEGSQEIQFLQLLQEVLPWDDVDQALAFEPENYRYLLGAIMFKSIAAFMTRMVVLSQGEEELLASLDAQLAQEAWVYKGLVAGQLETAKRVRPPQDILVFLAAALYHLSLAEYDAAEQAVLEALSIRPDLAEVHNALAAVASVSLLFADEMDFHGVGKVLIRVMDQKRAFMDLDARDHGTLFSYYLFRLKEPEPGQKSDPDDYSRASYHRAAAVALDPEHPSSLLAEGWGLALENRLEEAVKWFDRSLLIPAAPEDRAVFLLGRGVSRWYLKPSALSVLDVQLALKLDPSLEKGRQFLKGIGQ